MAKTNNKYTRKTNKKTITFYQKKGTPKGQEKCPVCGKAFNKKG